MLSEEYNFWSPTYNQLICPSLLVFFFYGNKRKPNSEYMYNSSCASKNQKAEKEKQNGTTMKGRLTCFLVPHCMWHELCLTMPLAPPHHLPFYLFVFLVQPLCPFLKVPSISRVWFPGKWEDNHNLWDLNKLKIFTQLGLIMQLCDFAGCA